MQKDLCCYNLFFLLIKQLSFRVQLFHQVTINKYPAHDVNVKLCDSIMNYLDFLHRLRNTCIAQEQEMDPYKVNSENKL